MPLPASSPATLAFEKTDFRGSPYRCVDSDYGRKGYGKELVAVPFTSSAVVRMAV